MTPTPSFLVRIFVQISYVYTATRRKLAIGTQKKLAIGTLTSETAEIYQYNSGILSPIQTKLSEYVYNILLISLQSLIRH